jgi:hypothetical protein
MRTSLFRILTVLATIVAASSALAQGVSDVSYVYEGFLEDSSGPFTGTATVDVGLFAADSGGAAVWTESHTNVPVAAGYFTVILGDVSALDAATVQANSWLEVSVAAGGNSETLGRQALFAVPFATSVDWDHITNVPSGFADGDDDAGGLGTVTSISAGTGLTVSSGGSPITTTGTLAVDFGAVAAEGHNHSGTYLPVGSSISCAAGQVVTGVSAAGDVQCTGARGKLGILWVTAPGDVAGAESNYNSAGQTNTASSTGTGTYSVTFTGLGGATGVPMVSAYGSNSVMCKIVSFTVASATVNVACHNSSGTAANSGFTIWWRSFG